MATPYSLFSPSRFLAKPTSLTLPNPSLSLHFPIKRVVPFRKRQELKRIDGVRLRVATDSAQPAVQLQNDSVQETQKQEEADKLVLPTNESSEELLRIRHTVIIALSIFFSG